MSALMSGMATSKVETSSTPGATVSAPETTEAVVASPSLAPVPAPARSGTTLKERAHQMSLYLEPEIYDALRLLAFQERTKMHSLLLEAVEMLFKKRRVSVGPSEDRGTDQVV